MRIGDLFAGLGQFVLGINVLKIPGTAAQPGPIGDHVQRGLPVLHAVAQRGGGLGKGRPGETGDQRRDGKQSDQHGRGGQSSRHSPSAVRREATPACGWRRRADGTTECACCFASDATASQTMPTAAAAYPLRLLVNSRQTAMGTRHINQAIASPPVLPACNHDPQPHHEPRRQGRGQRIRQGKRGRRLAIFQPVLEHVAERRAGRIVQSGLAQHGFRIGGKLPLLRRQFDRRLIDPVDAMAAIRAIIAATTARASRAS